MKFDKPIALAADHGGYELKEAIKAHLDELGVAYTDFGTDSTASVDYPDFAAKGCKAVQDGSCVGAGLGCQIVDAFLNAEFEGGRHQMRIDKMMALENH